MSEIMPLIFAKHQQVRSDLMKRIADNEFGETGRLPSERQLMAEYRVSGATVSRALTDLEQTGRIRRIWGKGTFVRHEPASHAMQIGVALNSFLNASHPWRLGLLQGIEIQAQQMNCRVHCLLMQDNRLLLPSPTENPLALMLEKGMVQGLILATPIAWEDAQELSRLSVPTVAIGSIYPGLSIASVLEDSQQAAEQVVNHLQSLGHCSIALFPGPIGESNSKMMRASSFYAQALIDRLADAGLDLDRQNIHPAGYAWDAIEPTVQRYVRSCQRPKVWIFRDDLQAQKAIETLESHGLNVPGDVAIVSFGDILPNSSLTSISVSPQAIGRRAVDLLIQARQNDPALAPCVNRMAVRLNVRRSSQIGSSAIPV